MKELIRTLSSFMLVIILVSVCGWCVIDTEPARKPLTLEYDKRLVKESLVANQAAAMAEATAIYNRNLELRARAGK